jgi:hypothetical protein
MTCSICGSKADGSRRGVRGLQPFCNEHYEVISTKQFDAWPEEFIKARIQHLTKWKTLRTERMGKDLSRTAALGAVSSLLGSSSTASLNLALIQKTKYETTVASIDAQKAELTEILASRSQAKPEQTSVTNDEIAPATMFCRECGKKIPKESKYCKECGAKLI